MKKINFKYSVIMLYLAFALGLAGCFSVPDSPDPRFYTLYSVDKDKVDKKYNISPKVMIGIGPARIPEYQNRPQIVTQNKDKTLNFAQFDRWGEPLDFALVRVLNMNLTAMLPGATIENFPWNLDIPIKYHVTIDVLQLDCELDKDLLFIAQWVIIDEKLNRVELVKRSEFRLPIKPNTYAGLAETLSRAYASLSSEIAETLVAMINELPDANKTN